MRSLFLLPLAAAAAAAQTPTRTLTKPDAEYAEPFSQLASIFELKDGRVVVADTRDKSLQAVDLRAGRATKIGREGAGPQEWNIILGLFGWKGDSVLANDAGNSRYLVIDPGAKPVRTFSPFADAGATIDAGPGGRGGRGGRADGGRAIVEERGGGRGRGPVRLGGGGTNVRGVDARGRIYSQDLALVEVNGTLTSADSAPITRFDVTTRKTDTIAYVNLPKNSASGTARSDGRGGESVSLVIGARAPYQAADVWTVFRDGTVAIVRVADYHVEIVKPNGQRVVGRRVPYTPVPIGEAEKQEWRDRMKGGVRLTIGGGDGRADASAAAAAAAAQLAQEPATWPATKPPFEGGAALAAPNGDVWVKRSRAAKDKIPTADIFNAQGNLVGTVKMPENTRLVGLGSNGVYAVRVDEDDLQYLQRYAMQWSGCVPEMKESCGR